MNTNFCIELSDDAAQNISGGLVVSFKENFAIYKYIESKTNISGNVATGVAKADASGSNTVTQTITLTDVYRGYGSSSTSGSVSATSGAYYRWSAAS